MWTSILTAPVFGSCPFQEIFQKLEHISDKPELSDLCSFTVWVLGEIWLQVAVSSKFKTEKKKEVLIYDPKH